MTLDAVAITRLEKAAVDNGFELELERTVDWLCFGSSQTSMQIWLTAVRESFVVAATRADVVDATAELGTLFGNATPVGAAGARSVSDIPALHRIIRRVFQLSRTLPDELLHAFEKDAGQLPRATEAERQIVQRVGQEIFRRGLLEFWDGRCAITGLAVPELLRASHIKPWSDCDRDAERLDIFNGLLLAPQLDAAFDKGFMTIAMNGTVVVAQGLSSRDRAVLGVDRPLRLLGLHPAHERYLRWHRVKLFRGTD